MELVPVEVPGLVGFRRQIVHGMWSAARCLSALDTADPSSDAPSAAAPQTAATFAVDFRAPVLLPSDVVLTRAPDVGGVTEFTLASADSGRVHLAGGVTLL